MELYTDDTREDFVYKKNYGEGLEKSPASSITSVVISSITLQRKQGNPKSWLFCVVVVKG